MKKFISLMLLFAMASFSWAQDVEEEEEEEEEVVEVVKPKAVKAAKKAGNSKMGLQISYFGQLDDVRFVYDMGTGLKLKGGLDITQTQEPAPTATDPAAKTAKNVIAIAVGADYQLGQALLPYGVSLDIDYNLDSKGMGLFPAFYTEVELIKNLSLGLAAGLDYSKENKDADAVISLGTKGLITFYFM